MQITLELKPELEACLIAQAEAQGLSIDRYLELLIESSLPISSKNLESNQPLSQDWKTFLEEFCNNPALANVPPLSDEAIGRESIYREREDAQLGKFSNQISGNGKASA